MFWLLKTFIARLKTHIAARSKIGPPTTHIGAITAPMMPECTIQAICFAPKPGEYSIIRVAVLESIRAPIEAPIAYSKVTTSSTAIAYKVPSYTFTNKEKTDHQRIFRYDFHHHGRTKNGYSTASSYCERWSEIHVSIANTISNIFRPYPANPEVILIHWNEHIRVNTGRCSGFTWMFLWSLLHLTIPIHSSIVLLYRLTLHLRLLLGQQRLLLSSTENICEFRIYCVFLSISMM